MKSIDHELVTCISGGIMQDLHNLIQFSDYAVGVLICISEKFNDSHIMYVYCY